MSIKFAYFHNTRIGRSIGVLAVAYMVSGSTITYATSFCTQAEIVRDETSTTVKLCDTFRKQRSRDISRGRLLMRPDLQRTVSIPTDGRDFARYVCEDLTKNGMSTDSGLRVRVRTYTTRDELWKAIQPRMFRRIG